LPRSFKGDLKKGQVELGNKYADAGFKYQEEHSFCIYRWGDNCNRLEQPSGAAQTSSTASSILFVSPKLGNKL